MTVIYLVEEGDGDPYHNESTPLAAFSSRELAEAFVARGPEHRRVDITIREYPFNPTNQGCYYRAVHTRDHLLQEGGWTYSYRPGEVHGWALVTYYCAGTQDEADAMARESLDQLAMAGRTAQ